MKELIRQVLNEEFSRREVILYNELNSKKKELKTKKELLEYIKTMCKHLNLDEKDAMLYYMLWKANYRKEGNYGKLTKDEIIDAKNLPARTIPNSNAKEFSRGRVPFKGSNLKAEWRKDKYGDEYYVIISYGWYPIFLYKEDKWFKVTNSYSRATGRQISDAWPVVWDETIGYEMYLVTKDEIQRLMYGIPFEKIMKEKVDNLISSKETFISKKPVNRIVYTSWRKVGKVKYKIVDIRKEGDKAVLDVLIQDAGELEQKPSRWGGGMEPTNKMKPSQGEYLTGKLQGLDKEKVEDQVAKNIILSLNDFIGKMPIYNHPKSLVDNPKYNIKFNFIHEKEPK